MAVTSLTELSRDEQLAFLGLVRILVRLDGEFSPEEASVMHVIAKRVGSTLFWKAMAEAQAVFGSADQVFAAARTLQRDEVRSFVYDCLVEIASVDGIDPSETQMLSWLGHEWGLGTV